MNFVGEKVFNFEPKRLAVFAASSAYGRKRVREWMRKRMLSKQCRIAFCVGCLVFCGSECISAESFILQLLLSKQLLFLTESRGAQIVRPGFLLYLISFTEYPASSTAFLRTSSETSVSTIALFFFSSTVALTPSIELRAFSTRALQ